MCALHAHKCETMAWVETCLNSFAILFIKEWQNLYTLGFNQVEIPGEDTLIQSKLTGIACTLLSWLQLNELTGSNVFDHSNATRSLGNMQLVSPVPHLPMQPI